MEMLPTASVIPVIQLANNVLEQILINARLVRRAGLIMQALQRATNAVMGSNTPLRPVKTAILTIMTAVLLTAQLKTRPTSPRSLTELVYPPTLQSLVTV